MTESRVIFKKENLRVAPQLTGQELEVMTVLWKLPVSDALKLSQIHKRIVQRRESYGEPVPALTTMSGTLRRMVARKLLVEGRMKDGQFVKLPQTRVQSTLLRIRSPKTAYQAGYTPSEALMPIFRMLINAYPPNKHYLAIIDIATTMDLEKEVIDKIQQLLPSA